MSDRPRRKVVEFEFWTTSSDHSHGTAYMFSVVRSLQNGNSARILQAVLRSSETIQQLCTELEDGLYSLALRMLTWVVAGDSLRYV